MSGAPEKKTAERKTSGKKITIRLKKGLIAANKKQRATVFGLGLLHREHERTLENTPAIRGAIKKVIHLLEIVSES